MYKSSSIKGDAHHFQYVMAFVGRKVVTMVITMLRHQPVSYSISGSISRSLYEGIVAAAVETVALDAVKSRTRGRPVHQFIEEFIYPFAQVLWQPRFCVLFTDFESCDDFWLCDDH